MRKINFSFEGGPSYAGYTDDTHWNGWLNVEVEKSVFDQVLSDFQSKYGDDFADMVGDMPEIQPNESGRYSFANGYCTSESDEPEMRNRTDAELLHEIEQLQAIQKSCSPATPKWRTASELLAPLFEEMAARQRREWYKNQVGYDPIADDPTMTNDELRDLVLTSTGAGQ